MAKKITFLLVMLFVLLAASVTAFAGGAAPAAPDNGSKEEKAFSWDSLTPGSITALEDKYKNIWFDDKAASDKNEIVNVTYLREYNLNNPLRHVFTGNVVNSTSGGSISDNPVVMLLYIKNDEGQYARLNSIETDQNGVEGSVILISKVDLLYLGSTKTNDVRVIAFRKNDADKLVLGKNLQISNYQITARSFKLIEKVKITFDEVVNSFNQKQAP
ncbi:MAG: hypothetical protein N2376_07585 [Clostridia bacterium]|nr:hypothetical protein [Clostridia bacterium]